MELVFTIVLGIILVAYVYGQEAPVGVVEQPSNKVEPVDNGLENTELLLAFVIIRHGDRTPDIEEMELNPAEEKNLNIFFPYGIKALTNRGKQRSYKVGQYLRKRYDGFISRLYLPDEITVRTTDYARTKMTALTILAAMYPPLPSQKWNPSLDWQPVPYDTLPYETDDLLYWYNCPRYIYLRDQTYDLPEIKKRIEPYQDLFDYLSEKTSSNISKAENVFFLDNLFQALENVGVKPPKWAHEVMNKIKQVTKIEFAVEFYTNELIRVATGVLMNDILNATNARIGGDISQPKLRIYSAHENNVAALMAAARVFQPHQPEFGATFLLELRRNRQTGQFGMTALYSPDAGKSYKILPISRCGGFPLCDYETFLSLTQDVIWSREEFRKQCPRLS